MTLATLQAQHPEWCFKCGIGGKTRLCWNGGCPPSRIIAALKEELAKAEAERDDRQVVINRVAEIAESHGWENDGETLLSAFLRSKLEARNTPRFYAPFNEDALGAEIARVFGAHGAHAEVYAMLRKTQAELEALRAERGKEKL